MREIPPEHDGGVAAVGVDVLAKRRDLEGVVVEHQRHRAMLDARRHGLHARRAGPVADDFRQGGGGDVDIAVGKVHQRVADGAADNAGLLAVAIEDAEHGLHRRSLDEAAGREAHGLLRPAFI